jgi:hypothetical protein
MSRRDSQAGPPPAKGFRYDDDRRGQKIGKPPAGNASPLNATAKSLRNPAGKNGTYGGEVSMNKANPLQIGTKADAPMYRTGGIGSPGKSPGTPAISGSQQPRFTSNPFKGRSNLGAQSNGKTSKMWGNGKPNNAP